MRWRLRIPAVIISPMDIKEANIKFHDGASDNYDHKWAIRFDQDMAGFVLKKFELGIGGPFPAGRKLMEIGCGTGYAMLNLGLGGKLTEAWGCDISQGMLDTCRRNADELGIEVHLECADAEVLPYADDEFEMVIGHAVLHHLPDLAASFRELYRVMEPGGVCVIAGEPTLRGHQIARVVKKVANLGIKAYARLGGKLGKKPVELRLYPAIVSGEEDHELQELEHISWTSMSSVRTSCVRWRVRPVSAWPVTRRRSWRRAFWAGPSAPLKAA